MSRASFTIAYDGPALRAGAMDVRDLAPALLGVGELFDAANAVLNGDDARIKIQVTATGTGSFEIIFEIVQSFPDQVVGLLTGEIITAAANLKTLIWVGGAGGLVWLIKRLKGRKPERIERLSDDTIRLSVDGDTFDVPATLLRLYKDLAVRRAAERVVSEPLSKPGIDKLEARDEGRVEISVTKDEALYFAKPDIPDETIIEQKYKSAFSIVSLAFKDDNKWRLHDGNTQISASIIDHDFLNKVDNNNIAFSKGDILVCEVAMVQKRTSAGLRTEHTVERVIEHRPASRQIPLNFDEPE